MMGACSRTEGGKWRSFSLMGINSKELNLYFLFVLYCDSLRALFSSVWSFPLSIFQMCLN